MPVKTQYYTTALHRGTNPENWLSTFLVEGLDALTPKEASVTVVIHGPYSRPHIERVPEGTGTCLQGELLENAYGNVYHPETGQRLFLPFCREIGATVFSQEWQRALSLLSKNRDRQHLCRIEKQLTWDSLAGEYHPIQLGSLPEAFSVDPAKFILTFFLRIRRMLEEKGHNGRCLIVLHPDILLFLGHGKWKSMRLVAQSLGNAAEVLALELVYENVTFANPVFRKILPWMSDPKSIAKLLPRTSGLCIDTAHLEQEGWSEKRISNMIHEAANLWPAVVHVDDRIHCSAPDKGFVSVAYSCGVPVAYEPRTEE